MRSAFKGFNVALSNFGSNGSGKTFTMLGTSEQPGLLPCIIDFTFQETQRRQKHIKVEVLCYMLEVYMGNLNDLLLPEHLQRSSGRDGGIETPLVQVVHLEDGTVEVQNMTVNSASDAAQMHRIFQEGLASRKSTTTEGSDCSSRSHLVFALMLRATNSRTGSVTEGKISMFDLAGYERLSDRLRVEYGQQYVREARAINASLGSLGNVVTAIVTGHQEVPYRDSVLAMLYRDLAGGTAKGMLLANISPADMCVEETVATLTFAERFKAIRNAAVPHNIAAAARSTQAGAARQLTKRLRIYAEQPLGHGGNLGVVVYKGEWIGRRDTWPGEAVAVKEVPIGVPIDVDREIDAMIKVRHNHVVQYLALERDEQHYYIVMELCDGTLEGKVSEGAPLDQPRTCKELAEALSFVHEQGLSHRDLKPANVFLKSSRVKLGDFGLAKEAGAMKQEHTQGVGTLGWMAPEVIEQEASLDATKADVFVLGLIFYYVLTGGKHPFNMKIASILRGNADLAALQHLPRMEATLPLVSAMISHDPLARPTAADCVREVARWSAHGVGGIYAREDERFPIILSYRTEVESIMLLICDRLRQHFGERSVVHGLMCEPGRPWDALYFEWMKRSSVFLLMLSEDYFASSACIDEFRDACQQQVPDPRDTERVVLPLVVAPLPWKYPSADPQCPEDCKEELNKRNCLPNPNNGCFMDDFEHNLGSLINIIEHYVQIWQFRTSATSSPPPPIKPLPAVVPSQSAPEGTSSPPKNRLPPLAAPNSNRPHSSFSSRGGSSRIGARPGEKMTHGRPVPQENFGGL